MYTGLKRLGQTVTIYVVGIATKLNACLSICQHYAITAFGNVTKVTIRKVH